MISVPDQVESAWAVVATAWHWPPSEMDRMTFGELMDWKARAEEILKRRN